MYVIISTWDALICRQMSDRRILSPTWAEFEQASDQRQQQTSDQQPDVSDRGDNKHQIGEKCQIWSKVTTESNNSGGHQSTIFIPCFTPAIWSISAGAAITPPVGILMRRFAF